MKVQVYIGQFKLDLFDDEKIEITQKLNDIEKLSNIFTDFTSTFTVPATPYNNQVFAHYYETDIDNTFNANIRVDGFIEIDTLPFKFGQFQLEAVAIKNNLPENYKITFYGKVKQLSDLFGDDTIDRLDYDSDGVKQWSSLSDLDYDYTGPNFLSSINNPSFKNGDIVTPLISYTNRDWNYGTNDALDISKSTYPILENELRPAIRIKKILEGIETKYGIVFSRDFFDKATFNSIFMWMNNRKEEITSKIYELPLVNNFTGLTSSYIYSNAGASGSFVFAKYDFRHNLYAANPNITQVTYNITPNASSSSANYDLYLYDEKNNIINSRKNLFGPQTITYKRASAGSTFGNFTISKKLRLFIKPYSTLIGSYSVAASSGIFNQVGSWPYSYTLSTSYASATSSNNPIGLTVSMSIADNIPKMKVKDFIDGIMKMFKLIIRPISTNSFYVDTINGFYSKGNILDLTKYIDRKEVQIERPTIYKRIEFKYQKTENIAGKTFRDLNNPITQVGYGDLMTTFDIDSKDELKIELPFENMLFERMTILPPSTQDGLQTNLSIGQSIKMDNNNVTQKNDCKPVLFFNNGIANNASTRVYWKYNLTVGAVAYTPIINNFNDEYLEQITDSLCFNAEVDPWTQQEVSSSLYRNYWDNWINTIYSLKQRKYRYVGYLPPRYVQEISLNDRIIIGDKRYKINDYTIDLVTGYSKFNLFTDVYDISARTDDYFWPNEILTNPGNRYYDINIFKGTTYSVTKVDTGDGTSWLNIVQQANNSLTIRIDEKATQAPPQVYLERSMDLAITIGTFSGTCSITQLGLEE
jgi:hypothetical protein